MEIWAREWGEGYDEVLPGCCWRLRVVCAPRQKDGARVSSPSYAGVLHYLVPNGLDWGTGVTVGFDVPWGSGTLGLVALY